jgi:hypothetical protein
LLGELEDIGADHKRDANHASAMMSAYPSTDDRKMNSGSMVAGDVDYGVHGVGYASQRRADPRIARHIHDALGDARTVLNIGAGAGSYEPDDRYVVAVEPSQAMRQQRGPTHVPAIDATAEALPFDDQSFDAAMATVTVHQWRDLGRGLAELRRVTRGPIAVLCFDADAAGERLWIAEYLPEMIAVMRDRDPAIERITALLGGRSDVIEIPVPVDCIDGFIDAYYARPEALLDPAVRRSQSTWNFIDEAVVARFVNQLSSDLASGEWDRRFGHLRGQPFLGASLRLIVNHPA